MKNEIEKRAKEEGPEAAAEGTTAITENGEASSAVPASVEVQS